MMYRKSLGCERYIILCYPLISIFYQKYKGLLNNKGWGQLLGPVSRTSLSAWFLGTLAPPVSFSLFFFSPFPSLCSLTSG